MKGGHKNNMNIELNQEELDLLIDSVTKEKNNTLFQIHNIREGISLSDYDLLEFLDHLQERLSSIYDLKTKLCNYSISLQEEN